MYDITTVTYNTLQVADDGICLAVITNMILRAIQLYKKATSGTQLSDKNSAINIILPPL